MSETLNTQLANALAAVASAQDYLVRMRAITDSAKRSEIDARDKVNEAQRYFDSLVAQVKKSALQDTDWGTAPWKGKSADDSGSFANGYMLSGYDN